jgi:putative colanic acid biosynthesis acetyltransferase WcaF
VILRLRNPRTYSLKKVIINDLVMRSQLNLFNSRQGLNRGRPRFVEAFWYLIKCILFLPPFPWPSFIKAHALRCFGAQIGQDVVIKPRVNVHYPWKLVVGDSVWIGEEVFILNFECVTILSHACISQRAFLCTGNHDYRDISFSYRNAPITIGSGAWIGACVFVCPGVDVGPESVATAGSVVTKSIPPNTIVAGNPAAISAIRWPIFE